MYAEIVTEPGVITAANMKTALVQVLTGETDVNNLPNGINTTASEIRFSINLAGWTQHDGEDVLKASLSYTIDHQKYAWLNITDTQFYFKAYEEWDEVAHTGTNGTTNTDTSHYLRWSLTQETIFYISASERHILINTNYGTTWGDSNYGCFLGLFEFQNQLINHGTDYVPYFGILVGSLMLEDTTNSIDYCNNYRCFYLCRSLDYRRLTIINDLVFCTPPGTINQGMTLNNLYPNGWDEKIVMPDLTNILIKIPLELHRSPNYKMAIGRISVACDTWFLPRATESGDGNRRDTLSHGSGSEYIAFYAGGSFYWAVPNG